MSRDGGFAFVCAAFILLSATGATGTFAANPKRALIAGARDAGTGVGAKPSDGLSLVPARAQWAKASNCPDAKRMAGFTTLDQRACAVRQAKARLSSRAKTPCSRMSISTTNMMIQARTWVMLNCSNQKKNI